MRVLGLVLVGCWVGCAAPLPSANEALFQSAQVRAAMKNAPDLVVAAERAWDTAVEQDGLHQPEAAADYRDRSRLLLAASIVESERIDLARRLQAVRTEMTRLLDARDAERVASVNRAYQATRATLVADAKLEHEQARTLLRRADLGQASRKERARLAKLLLKRAQVLITIADALGADTSSLTEVRSEHIRLSTRRVSDPESVEALLWDVHRVLGQARARQPEPSNGASDALVRSAADALMTTEPGEPGIAVHAHIERGRARADARTVRRMVMLVDGFPHGPVQCSLLGVSERAWRNMHVDFQPLEESHGGRVSLSVAPEQDNTQELVCTFTGYSQP